MIGEKDICMCEVCGKAVALCIWCGGALCEQGENSIKCMNGGNSHICFKCDMMMEGERIEEEMERVAFSESSIDDVEE